MYYLIKTVITALGKNRSEHATYAVVREDDLKNHFTRSALDARKPNLVVSERILVASDNLEDISNYALSC